MYLLSQKMLLIPLEGTSAAADGSATRYISQLKGTAAMRHENNRG